jgi:serine/threonine protein kinase
MGRRLVTDKITSDDILGTNGYHAPEVLFEDSYDFRADIFMLGLTFCVMVGSTYPDMFELSMPDLRLVACKHEI